MANLPSTERCRQKARALLGEIAPEADAEPLESNVDLLAPPAIDRLESLNFVMARRKEIRAEMAEWARPSR